MDEAILTEKLKQALGNYTSCNGKSLNFVINYMRQAEKTLKANKNFANKKALENLVSECKRKIYENNRGLVVHIVRRYCPPSYEHYEDFISEGIVGLLNAIPKYIPKKGKFSNYAGTAIRLNIIRRMQEISGNIRLPINILHYQREIAYFSRKFKEKHNRYPSDEELAEISGKKVRRIKTLKRLEKLAYTPSLDEDKSEDKDEGSNLMDYIDSYKNLSMEDIEIRKMICEGIINRVNKLKDKKEKRILLGRLEGKTLQELALEENLTRERIRQIEKKAKINLQNMGVLSGFKE